MEKAVTSVAVPEVEEIDMLCRILDLEDLRHPH